MIIRAFMVATLICGFAPRQSPSADEAVSVCDLRDRPEFYQGRVVTVSGIYQTDRRHTSFVYSDGCDGLILAPYFEHDGAGSRSSDRFRNAVAGELRDLSLRTFRVEFRGALGQLDRERVRRFDVSEVISFERIAD